MNKDTIYTYVATVFALIILVLLGACQEKPDRINIPQDPEFESKAVSKTERLKWQQDVTEVVIPEVGIHGILNGKPFRVDRAEISGRRLTLVQGNDFFPDAEFNVAIGVNTFAQQALDGLDIRMKTTDERSNDWYVTASTSYKEKPTDQMAMKGEMMMNGFSLQLKYGQLAGGMMPVSIYLTMPGENKDFVAGRAMVPFKP